MKRFITVLSGLLVLPAFAEVAPVYYDEIVEYTDEMIDAADEAEQAQNTDVATQQKGVAQRTTINRSTSRAISSAGTATAQRSGASSRAIASSSRATTARSTVSRSARPASVVSRSSTSRGANVVSRSSRAGTTAKPVTARVGTSGNPVMGAYKNTTSSSSLNTIDDTNSTYNSARAANTRRATVRASTGITSATVSTTPVITEEDISTTTSNLTAIAELTDYCKAQYAACMDNYCNVLDDNQGRCSCSKNIKNYEKIEQALSKANEEFQDVIQQIKYIGLTAEQINSLFDETIAEQTMADRKNDSSRLQDSLTAIKKKIVDASSPSASSSVSTGVSLDTSGLFNVDVTAGGIDINSFLGNNGSNTQSVSNQRGEQLFKTATNRCKTAVLNSCVAQGIDANVITNSYDLEIDKQCIAYERNLNDSNAEMRQNIINASTILKQARLVLAQNKNTYDVRSCVAAIDSCMQDEYICGSDYELCLDPTGKYLANGEIVKGGTPGVSGGTVANEQLITESNMTTWASSGMYNLYSVWNYKDGAINDSNTPGIAPIRIASDTTTTPSVFNAWGAGRAENLNSYIDAVMTDWAKNYEKTTASNDMATYLLRKLGYIGKKDNKVHGMCASVMKQCQDYTYTSKGEFKPDNEVIRQYLASALTKVKLRQDSILADYAEDCRSDVSSCLSTNGYDESNTGTTASKTAVNACRADIMTCMSVGGYMPKDNTTLTLRKMSDWVASMLKTCPANYYLVDTDSSTVECKPCGDVEFKQWNAAGTALEVEKTDYLESAGGQVTSCHCPSGYTDREDSNGTMYCLKESN